MPNPFPFNHQYKLPDFKEPNCIIGFRLSDILNTTDDEIIFAGKNFLLDEIDNIFTVETLSEFIKNNELNVSAQELEKAIRELQFQLPKDGTKIDDKNKTLFTISGNPLAIALVETMATSIIGEMTAVASYTRTLVNVKQRPYKNTGKKYRDILLFPQNFAYFGGRRGSTYKRLIDEAAIIGGFHFIANINGYVTDSEKTHKYRPEIDLKLTGTTAHAFITYLSSILDQAEKHKKVDVLFDAFKFPQAVQLKYQHLKNQLANKQKPDCDLYDFFSFCAYTQSVGLVYNDMEAENKANNPHAGKLPPRSIVNLVDTTNTIEGIKAAIAAAIATRVPFTGIRLDTTPEKFIIEAAKLLQEAHYAHPLIIPATTKIYSTDAIDEESLNKIYQKYCSWLEAPAANPEQPKISFPLVFGIGSSVANKKPLKLKKEKLMAINANLPSPESLGPRTQPPAAQDDVYNHLTSLPSDAYAYIQWALVEKITNTILKDTGLAPIESVATLNYRHREDSPNYLIVAGVEQVQRVLNNFVFTPEVIERIQACNPGFPKEFYNKLLGQRLDIEISGLKDGQIANPYTPIINIKGHPGHVLMVESYILSTIGSMSSVATQARETINALGFTAEELKNDQNLIDACNFYALNPEEINNPLMKQIEEIRDNQSVNLLPETKEAVIKFLMNNFDPTFSYCGLSSERDLTTQRAFAARVGGFKETTQEQELMTTTKIAVNVDDYLAMGLGKQFKCKEVFIDLDQIHLEDLSERISGVNYGVKLQIRGDMTNMPLLRQQLIKARVDFEDVTFLCREPIASTENLKGTVFKQGANLFQTDNGIDIERTIKAAGSEKKPGLKCSIPGVNQQAVLLRNSFGKPIAIAMVDLDLFPKNKHSEKDVLQAILNEPTQFYYNRGKDKDGQKNGKDIIAMAPLYVGLEYSKAETKNFTAEFLLTQQSQRFTKTAKRNASNAEIRRNLNAAAKRAKKALDEDHQNLPIYMEAKMYNKMLQCMPPACQDAYDAEVWAAQMDYLRNRHFHFFSPQPAPECFQALQAQVETFEKEKGYKRTVNSYK